MNEEKTMYFVEKLNKDGTPCDVQSIVFFPSSEAAKQYGDSLGCSYVVKDMFSKECLKELYKAEYRHYLLSERWYNIRHLALKRDGYRCRDCGSVDRLEIHHRSYKHVKFHPKNCDEINQEFIEELGDVMTLCKSCHMKRHGLVQGEKNE